MSDLRGRDMEVSVKDRALFNGRNVPEADDDPTKMQEWIRSVKGSIKRREELESREHRDLRSYFE